MADENNFNQNWQQPQYVQAPQTPPQPPKKPIYKKWWFWVLIVLAVIILISVIGGGSKSGDDKTAGATTSAVQAEDKKSTDTVGDYKCVVKKATLCKDYEGKNAVKIVYEWTNNSGDAVSFDVALNDEVYQDGVQLETAYSSDDDIDYGIDSKIKPGKSKEVAKIYLLKDTKTDLEVEISELISFSDDVIKTKVAITK